MPIGEIIRSERERRDMSQSQLAAIVGTNQQTVDRIERGLTKNSKHLMPILKKLGLDNMIMPVPIVGYVGAGSEMHHYANADHPNEYVPMISGGNDSTVALQIRGSSLGSVFDTWLVYYDEVRFPPTPDMLGQLCVVGLGDDRVLVKRLRRGSVPSLFNLESVTEALMEDVPVVWAAKVKTMSPKD